MVNTLKDLLQALGEEGLKDVKDSISTCMRILHHEEWEKNRKGKESPAPAGAQEKGKYVMLSYNWGGGPATCAAIKKEVGRTRHSRVA